MMLIDMIDRSQKLKVVDVASQSSYKKLFVIRLARMKNILVYFNLQTDIE